MIEDLYVHRPCGGDVVCPFRTDCMRGWLGDGAERVARATTFVCHKDKAKQCAGHMLVVEGNAFRQMAERFGIELKLTGKELVFSNEEEMIHHHKEQ